ncbi:hypothetical protein SAMN05660706_10288 [Desulfoscipio geothermicus DSM 3669]|uniref:Uncharacterized protein n=1 Tax=Desulfoscipio geothermicus DSM 3669 TaxID=1121426 RepID=A0A1I6CUR2_9FIRM|nr:hypothetical protein SAMN05660706_10288 [Desulfoscipio geothermicus DSM 3669]
MRHSQRKREEKDKTNLLLKFRGPYLLGTFVIKESLRCQSQDLTPMIPVTRKKSNLVIILMVFVFFV